MNQTSAQQWTALSALYEQADELPPAELPGWLAALRRAGHPLLPQLQRMLSARAQIETDDFLVQLPKIVPVAPAPAGPLWTAGSRVGAWRLVRPLGEGGMAEVWLAERDDGAFARRVAIKLPFPRPGREGLAARFDRERDILASLRHPHIAGLFDAGVTAQGQAWLALEYVEGVPLSVHCDRRHLPVRERVALFRQVLLAVQHAHANLVIHRDLKPGNILVTAQGEARLLDFGIAKLLEAEGGEIAETELTRAAGRSLTPRYASPEQLTGRPLTIACDVYALGVVLYELLCGERPYEVRADSAAQLEQAILEVEPRAPSRRTGNSGLAADRGATPQQLRRVLCPELDAIVLRCLRKPVTERYSSVDALLADVDRWLAGEAVLARAPSPWYRFIKFTLRHRLGMGMGAAALAALVGMTTVATVFGLHAREESARAVASRDFMLELFSAADREKSRGVEITARELLNQGRADVLVKLRSQPKLQADLLDGIASIQFDMGEFANANATFEQLVSLAAAAELLPMQIHALVGQADTALRLGDFKRADQLLKQASKLGGEPQKETVARMEIVQGWIAAFSGQLAVAFERFEHGHALATQAKGLSSRRAVDALIGEIYVEGLRRNYAAAFDLLDRVELIVRGSSSPDQRQLASLIYSRAQLTFSAGRFAEGWIISSRALAECWSQLGANDESCRRLLLVKLASRMRMGYGNTTVDELRAADMMSSDSQTPIVQVEALYNLLRLESTNGDTPRRRALFDQATSLLTSAQDTAARRIDGLNKIRLMVGLAESEVLLYRTSSAIRLARQAMDEAAAGVKGSDRWTVWAQMVEGIALRLSGDASAALPYLVASHDKICDIFRREHAICKLSELNVAVALADLGQISEALALVEKSKNGVEASFGRDSPVFMRLVSLERDLRSRPVGSTLSGAKRALNYIFI